MVHSNSKGVDMIRVIWKYTKHKQMEKIRGHFDLSQSASGTQSVILIKSQTGAEKAEHDLVIILSGWLKVERRLLELSKGSLLAIENWPTGEGCLLNEGWLLYRCNQWTLLSGQTLLIAKHSPGKYRMLEGKQHTRGLEEFYRQQCCYLAASCW